MATAKHIHTHYDNLGVSRKASLAEINAAFLKIGRSIFSSNLNEAQKNSNFEVVKSSHDVLVGAESRKRHDEWIAAQELAQAIPIKLQSAPVTPTYSIMAGGFVGMFEKKLDVCKESIQFGEIKIFSNEVKSITAGSEVLYVNGIKSGTNGKIIVKSDDKSIGLHFSNSFYFKDKISKYHEALGMILRYQGDPLLLSIIQEIDREKQVTIGELTFNRNGVEFQKKRFGISLESVVVKYKELECSSGFGQVCVAKNSKSSPHSSPMDYIDVPNAILVPSICSYLTKRYG